MKVEFVDSQRERHGVQPVLRALHGTPAQIAPSTYYAAKTRIELANAIFDYLEIFYNRQRRHSLLGMLSPVEYERVRPLSLSVA